MHLRLDLSGLRKQPQRRESLGRMEMPRPKMKELVARVEEGRGGTGVSQLEMLLRYMA